MAVIVPVTEEEKKSPLYAFFERDLTPAPQERYDEIAKGPIDPAKAHHPKDMNKLFDPGYVDGEFGYCRFPDGGTVVANLTFMPGVTVEMFDWWFAWHGVQPMRYKIWDKEDHYYCQTRDLDKALDSSLSFKERYWDTTHDVTESMVGDGQTRDIQIAFRNPADMGFDKEKLANFDGTIVVSGGKGRPGMMAHFVRPVEGGIELRTRFWMGYSFENGEVKSVVPPDVVMPLEPCQALLYHNVKEYTHLASILPELFALYKDKFEPF